METFIVVKGRIAIKAPRLVKAVSFQSLIERYEDVIWEKTERGSELRKQIDAIIRNRVPVSGTEQRDVWMFDVCKVVGPQQIFGEVVLI